MYKTNLIESIYFKGVKLLHVVTSVSCISSSFRSISGLALPLHLARMSWIFSGVVNLLLFLASEARFSTAKLSRYSTSSLGKKLAQRNAS